MKRLGAAFIALCMITVAGAVAAVLYLALGINPLEATVAGLAVLVSLAVYNSASGRVRDRDDVGEQIADLSRGTADLARQVGELGRRVVSAITANLLFISAAVPLRIFPPLFNRYVPGKFFGEHVDNCIRGDNLTGMRIRTDLSATLFLSDPEEYEGGELVIDDYYGSHRVKLPAGHMVLYPASSLHMVTPVTRGVRTASFFWIQSMIKDAHARRLTFEMDNALQELVNRLGRNDPEVRKLTNIYHNLIRYWAEV